MAYYVVAWDFETENSPVPKTDYKVYLNIKDAEQRYLLGVIKKDNEKSIKTRDGEDADILAARLYEVDALNERHAQEVVDNGSGLKLKDSIDEEQETARFLDDLLKDLPKKFQA